MSRKFKARNGDPWLVERRHAGRELIFRPLEGAERDERITPLPSHTNDPYELSDEELQRLLEQSRPRFPTADRPSPFKD